MYDAPKVAQPRGVREHAPPENIQILGLGNAISSIFCSDLIRRKMQLVSYYLLYLSLELSVRYILHEKRRVTPSELWNNKRITEQSLTQSHQYSKNEVSVISIFKR